VAVNVVRISTLSPEDWPVAERDLPIVHMRLQCPKVCRDECACPCLCAC
jgi:hypothetical protein